VVHEAEIDLRLSVTLVGSKAVPLDCFSVIPRHALAFLVCDAKIVLRDGVALVS
jgi:hypothetical protein